MQKTKVTFYQLERTERDGLNMIAGVHNGTYVTEKLFVQAFP